MIHPRHSAPRWTMARSRQPAARTGLVETLDGCVEWGTMEIHHPFRNGHPSVEQKSVEEACPFKFLIAELL